MLPLSYAVAQQDSLAHQNPWRFQGTPYVWMTGLQGDIRPTAKLPTAHSSQSFSDVPSNLDAAAFVNATACKGDSVLPADFTYAAVSDSASLPMGLQGKAKATQRSITLVEGKN